MARTLIYKCDVCGREKKEANKWLMVEQGQNNFYIWHWDDACCDDFGIKLICGEACLHSLLQPFLSSRK